MPTDAADHGYTIERIHVHTSANAREKMTKAERMRAYNVADTLVLRDGRCV